VSPNLRRRLRRATTVVEFERFGPITRRTIVVANAYAVDAQQASIGTEELACAFVTSPTREHLGLDPTLEDVGRSLTALGYHLGATTTGPATETGMEIRAFTKEVKAIIVDAVAVANAAGRAEVGSEHLLLALLDRPKSRGARALLDLGVEPSAVRARDTDDPGGTGTI
jgi:ATP-dependent Clp protease ATP-binding subunit ClpA